MKRFTAEEKEAWARETDPRAPLKSTNPDFDPDEILACFDASDRGAGAVDDTEDSAAVFEHGQWWVTCPSGAQFSVVDATGGGSVGGFDFEQVSEGER